MIFTQRSKLELCINDDTGVKIALVFHDDEFAYDCSCVIGPNFVMNKAIRINVIDVINPLHTSISQCNGIIH